MLTFNWAFENQSISLGILYQSLQKTRKQFASRRKRFLTGRSRYLFIHLCYLKIYFYELIYFINLQQSSETHLYAELTYNPGREVTLGCLLSWSPKFKNNVSLFVGPTNLGTIVNFKWVDQEVVTRGVIFCIIIWHVHKFIRYCLIPLDPCL